MKIITWNCNGAFRKKLQYLEQFNADILVIQECEDPKQSTKAYEEWASNYLWIGKNKNKGLGIFAKKEIEIEKLNWNGDYYPRSEDRTRKWKSEDLELFIPCLINENIPLLAVWTKQANSPNFGYIGQLWMYLQIHKEKLNRANQIICGDLNSNSIWDSWDRWWNHSDVLKDLESIKLKSVYHEIFKEDQGKEKTPTFYLQRKTEKPYHIDYFFVREEQINKSKLTVHKKENWLEISDHMPIELTIKHVTNGSTKTL